MRGMGSGWRQHDTRDPYVPDAVLPQNQEENKNMARVREDTSLVENMLWGTEDCVDKTIKEIRGLAKTRELCLRFSGGKDSIVAKHLLDMAGVPYCARFSKTSVDPPELMKYIRKYHTDVIVEKPKLTMFQLIVKKGFPPTRVCRYCCQEFKERNTCGKGKEILTLTGVRKAESPRRKRRSKYETCQLAKGVEFFHPIVDWSDEQIWDFIEVEHLPYCRLYDEGFSRIGCVGCPLASSENILAEFKRWPMFEKAYLWAFERMLEGRSFDKWKTKFDVMDWYIYGAEQACKVVADRNQLSLFQEDYFDQFDLDDEDSPILSAEQTREIMEMAGAIV